MFSCLGEQEILYISESLLANPGDLTCLSDVNPTKQNWDFHLLSTIYSRYYKVSAYACLFIHPE